MAKTFAASFTVWMKQCRNWKIVSIRSMLTRFFQRLALTYNNIYIRELGADPIQLGIVNSFKPIADTVIAIPFGMLQDRYSLRKIFLTGVGLMLIVRLIYSFATGWMMIMPAMLLATVATRIGSCMTICFVSLKDEDRSICRGICDGFFAAPSLIAPTVAALIITYFGGISVEGIRPIYFIQLIADLILFLFLATQLTEIKRDNVINKTSDFLGNLHEVFEHGTALKRYIAFSAVSTFSMSMMTPFMFPFAHEIKTANQLILGGMTTASLVIQSSLSIPLANRVGGIGRKKLIYLLEPLYWVSIIVLVLAPSPEFLLVSSIFRGFRLIADFTCLTPLMMSLVPVDCFGRWRGIVGMFGGLVSIPAPIIGGIIWENLGPSYVFLISMIIDILIRIPILTTIPDKLREKS